MDQRLLEIFVDLLEEHFPKGECQERGQALVLVAEAMFQIENGWLPQKIEDFSKLKGE